LPVVGQTCVFNLLQRLKPVFTKIGKMKSGSNDPTSNWAKCRLKWATQLLILFRSYKDLGDLGLVENAIPEYFKPKNLPQIKLEQIGWWDKYHVECVIAGLGGCKTQVCF